VGRNIRGLNSETLSVNHLRKYVEISKSEMYMYNLPCGRSECHGETVDFAC